MVGKVKRYWEVPFLFRRYREVSGGIFSIFVCVHYKKPFILWWYNFVIDHWKFVIKFYPWWFQTTSCIERHRLNRSTFFTKTSQMNSIHDVLKTSQNSFKPVQPSPSPLSMTKINVTNSIAMSHNIHVADDLAAERWRGRWCWADMALTCPMMWH